MLEELRHQKPQKLIVHYNDVIISDYDVTLGQDETTTEREKISIVQIKGKQK